MTMVIERLSDAHFPTEHGTFRIVAYRAGDGAEHVAVVAGDLATAAVVPVRVHRQCLAGDLLGSLDCDCGRQLSDALRRIEAAGAGVVVYLRGGAAPDVGIAILADLGVTSEKG